LAAVGIAIFGYTYYLRKKSGQGQLATAANTFDKMEDDDDDDANL
jgi:hypothetical protein